MKRKKLSGRIMACALSAIMAFGSVSTAFASETANPDTPAVTEEVQNAEETAEPVAEALVEEPADETPAEEPAAEPAAETPTEEPAAEPAAETPTEEPAAEPVVETPVEEQVEEAPVMNEATELRHTVYDAEGKAVTTVTAEIQAESFEAEASAIEMEVKTLSNDEDTYLQNLMKEKLTENTNLGDYVLYDIGFKVNGEITEPQKEIKLTYSNVEMNVQDTKTANVFYYDPADAEVAGDKDEVVEITQRNELVEHLQQTGQSTENVDDNDLSEISLKADGTTDKIQMEVRKSTIYGCYVEEEPEPVAEQAEETTEQPTAESAVEEAPEVKEEAAVETLTYEDDEVSVQVSADAEGAIPEGASLKVVPILSDDKETEEQYKEVEEQLKKKAENETYDIAGFLAYDISLVDKEGNEVEPNGEVKVTMDYKKEALPENIKTEEAKAADVTVLHLEEDGNGNVQEVVDLAEKEQIKTMSTTEEQKVEKAEFVTESFSVFTIIWNNSNNLKVQCTDINGNALSGQTISANVSSAVEVSTIAPEISGYQFSGAYVGNTEISYLRYSSSRWKYSTNGNRYYTVSNTVYFKYSEDTSSKIKVYVYVASRYTIDGVTYSWTDNEEFKELIGLTQCDNNAYFPAGEIYLDRDFLSGKDYTTQGSALITSKSDWTDLMDALGELKTDTLCDSTVGGNFAENNGNSVGEYLDQAFQDVGYQWGSQHTALFRWNYSPSYGFEDQTVQYHLDLRFNVNTITFKDADTEEIIDSRTYITGSKIQEPRNLNIPQGYQFVGYFKDKECTIPWDGIGTPLNEDKLVYVKIAEMDKVTVHYVNVTGTSAGSLSSYYDILNPETGVAVGSTATANAGYTFVGWYSDVACTNKISGDANFVPQKPESGWVETTYYAKFSASGEPVNFFLNLSSKIMDSDGAITGQAAGDFTTSVSGTLSAIVDEQGAGVPINTDLRVKVPADHTHGGFLGVIGGESANARDTDRLIRSLEEGTTGNQGNQTNKTYRIINSNGEGDFPEDEEIFKYIQDNWSETGGVNKGKDITVNGVAINPDYLTTSNFAIRWYVFKDQSGYTNDQGEYVDCWHIDGILVPKSGILNIKKTFDNQEVATSLRDSFAINVTGNFLAGTNEKPNTTITKKIADAVETENADGTVTYTWSLAIFGNSYTVAETGYTPANGWKYLYNEWSYKNAQKVTTYNKPEELNDTEVTINTTVSGTDTGATPEQTFSFSNHYTEDEDGVSYITVSKKFTGLTWNQIQSLKTTFSIDVKDENDVLKRTLKLTDTDVTHTPSETDKENEVQDYVFTWKINNAGTGTYKISESGQELDGYTVTQSGTGDIKVANGTWSLDKGTIKTIPDQKETNFSFKEHQMILASLKANGGYLIWTYEELSTTQRTAVISAINSAEFNMFGTGGATIENCHFYYGDALKNGITYLGATISYKDGKLAFTNKSTWQHLATGEYGWEGTQNADVQIVNDYAPDLDLVKQSKNTGALIDGAEFSLYKGTETVTDGVTAVNWEAKALIRENIVVNQSNQAAEIKGLQKGIYELAETKSPEGHAMLGTSIYFKVANGVISLCDKDGNPIAFEQDMWSLATATGNVLTIKNEILYELPSTGGNGIYWYLISGTLLMMAGALILYKNKRGEVLES